MISLRMLQTISGNKKMFAFRILNSQTEKTNGFENLTWDSPSPGTRDTVCFTISFYVTSVTQAKKNKIMSRLASFPLSANRSPASQPASQQRSAAAAAGPDSSSSHTAGLQLPTINGRSYLGPWWLETRLSCRVTNEGSFKRNTWIARPGGPL